MADITNYFERSISLLASQFQTRNVDGSLTNLQKLIKALMGQAQVLNTQQQLLLMDRFLNKAYGAQLDGLGQILGLTRIPGQSDDSYQEDLQFQIFINQSNGTPEEIMKILTFLTNASEVWYFEDWPAGYQLATNGLDAVSAPAKASDLIAAFQAVSPAGVLFIVLIATYGVNPFVFSSDPFDEQFYVNPNPDDPTQFNPFQVDPGSGLVNFFIQRGEVSNPNFGGGLAEALGEPPNFIGVDTTGAGQLAEAIQTNGNIPPPY